MPGISKNDISTASESYLKLKEYLEKTVCEQLILTYVLRLESGRIMVPDRQIFNHFKEVCLNNLDKTYYSKIKALVVYNIIREDSVMQEASQKSIHSALAIDDDGVDNDYFYIKLDNNILDEDDGFLTLCEIIGVVFLQGKIIGVFF